MTSVSGEEAMLVPVSPTVGGGALSRRSAAVAAQAPRAGRTGAWGLLLMFGLVGAAAGSFTVATTALGTGGVQALALGTVQLIGALLLGGTCWRSAHPRLEERAQRLAYADSVGGALAARPLEDQDDPALALRLRQVLRERGRCLPVAAYRSAADPDRDWQALALDPRVQDVPFLKAALTLARLEGRRTRGAARARLRATHQAIWRRLRALDPSMLAVVRHL